MDRKKVVDPRSPCVGRDHIAVTVHIRDALHAVVHMANRAFKRGRGDAPSKSVVGVRFRKDAVGGDRDELVLAVPREVNRIGATHDARHATCGIVGIRAARPRGDPVACSARVGRGTARICHGEPVPRRVVGVRRVAVCGEAVEIIIGIGAAECICAERMVPRNDAADGVIGVCEAAERGSVRRRPDDVRHTVHHIVGVGRDEAAAIRDGGDHSVPAAVAETGR